MMRALRNKIVHSGIGLFIVGVLAFAPFSPTLQHSVVHAGPVGQATEVTQLANNGLLGSLNVTAATNAVSNSIAAWATNALAIKEFTLDAVAWGLINIVLQEMIRSITEWVNAGFPDGGPAFVRDFGGFLRNIADEVVGNFIFESPLGFMCSPFQLDVKLALSAQYLFGREIGETGYRAQCRLSEVMENVQNFTINVDGDIDLDIAANPSNFAAGGWAWWLGSTAEQENNVYGAYAKAQSALAIELSNARGEKKEILSWNKGFLNFERCDPPGSKNCTTVTPGTVIESQLNKALGGGQDRLTIADEINELVAALLAQLAQQVIGGVGGLFGSTQPFAGNNSAPNYFDRLNSENSLGAGRFGAGAIDQGESYIDENERIIALVNEANVTVSLLRNSTDPGISAIASSPEAQLPDGVSDGADRAVAEVTNTQAQIGAIEALQQQMDATDDPNEQVAIVEQITALQDQMPSAIDTAILAGDIDNELIPAMQTWYDAVAEEIRDEGRDPADFIPSRYLN